MTDPGREADLWSAALRYDDRAFAALFDLHRDRVFRHALRLVSARSEAEDIVAMTFAALWRRRDAVRVVEGSVLPWLLVTATNHARNHARSARRYQSLLHRLPHSVEEDPAGIVAERLDRQQAAGRLGDALRRLSETDAVLLTLTVLEGVSTAEAAAVVGVTPAAARTRLTRARRKLRAELEPAMAAEETR